MSESQFNQHLPSYLKSFKSDEHFKRCSICNGKLEDVSLYIIEKNFHRISTNTNFDPIHEHAVCVNCTQMMNQEVSEESMESMQIFMQKHGTELMQNINSFKESENPDLNLWNQYCSFTRESISNEKEYTISAMIQDGQMINDNIPIITSGKFVQSMYAILSKSTKEYFDDFKDEFYDLPPDIKEIVNTPVRVF